MTWPWRAVGPRLRIIAAMKSTLVTCTALASVAALGGLAGATLSADSTPATAADTTAAPVEVRTQVVHRTVRVVRHVHVKHHRRAAPVAAPAVVPVSRPVAAAPAAAPAAAAPAATPAPAPRPRVVTRTSGASSHGESDDHGREHESEGGDD